MFEDGGERHAAGRELAPHPLAFVNEDRLVLEVDVVDVQPGEFARPCPGVGGGEAHRVDPRPRGVRFPAGEELVDLMEIEEQRVPEPLRLVRRQSQLNRLKNGLSFKPLVSGAYDFKGESVIEYKKPRKSP